MVESETTREQLLRENAELRARLSAIKVTQRAAPFSIDSEELYRTVANDAFDNDTLGIMIFDKAMRLVWCNRAAECFFGIRLAALIGVSQDAVLSESILPCFAGGAPTFTVAMTADLADGVASSPCRLCITDGDCRRSRTVQCWTRRIAGGMYAGGRIDHYADIGDDAAVRADSNELHDAAVLLIRNAADIIVATNVDEIIIVFNPAASAAFGYRRDEVVGKKLSRLFENPAEGRIVREIVEIEGVYSGDVTFRRKSGLAFSARLAASLLCDSNGKKVGYMGISADISKTRKLEEEILRVKRLDLIGNLAAGIAHDFNNLLTGVIGNISLAKMQTDQSGRLHDLLSRAESASEEAQHLTRQLLTFSNGGAPVTEVVAPAVVVRETVSIAVNGGGRVDFDLAEDLWGIRVDREQIVQAIQNLVMNAHQAMPDGGVIGIRAENVSIDSSSSLPIKRGNYVRISVSDTGIGIPKDLQDRVFEPFFTTKQKGSGLGLATAFSILNQHDGLIAVESELGEGATFTMFLPAEVHGLDDVSLETTDSTEDSLTRNDRILIMDDDEIVRLVAGEMLKESGFTVDFAHDGEEALDLYQKADTQGERFGLVILDLTVPAGLGGKDTIDRLRQLDPDVTAIVSSGYNQDPIMANYEKYGFKGVISKPYRASELVAVVQNTLQKSG